RNVPGTRRPECLRYAAPGMQRRLSSPARAGVRATFQPPVTSSVLVPLQSSRCSIPNFTHRVENVISSTGRRWTTSPPVMNARPNKAATTSRREVRHEGVEEALRLSEEKFLKVFHGNPNPALITRLSDGRVLEANEAFCEWFGISLE